MRCTAGRDHENECDVVIRVLRADAAADSTLRPGLAGDVFAAGALAHPNILKIYDVGTTPDALYVVSEPFDGETLRAVLDQVRLPVRTAIPYAARIASALVAAHWKGIVHGDVRPENILLTRTRVVVLGFGLMAATRGDASSDVFGFAAVCRELLTGRRQRAVRGRVVARRHARSLQVSAGWRQEPQRCPLSP